MIFLHLSGLNTNRLFKNQTLSYDSFFKPNRLKHEILSKNKILIEESIEPVKKRNASKFLVTQKNNKLINRSNGIVHDFDHNSLIVNCANQNQFSDIFNKNLQYVKNMRDEFSLRQKMLKSQKNGMLNPKAEIVKKDNSSSNMIRKKEVLEIITKNDTKTKNLAQSIQEFNPVKFISINDVKKEYQFNIFENIASIQPSIDSFRDQQIANSHADVRSTKSKKNKHIGLKKKHDDSSFKQNKIEFEIICEDKKDDRINFSKYSEFKKLNAKKVQIKENSFPMVLPLVKNNLN